MRSGLAFGMASLLLALSAAAAAQAKTPEFTMDRDAYLAARDKIVTRSEQAISHCKTQTDSAQRRCKIQAEGLQKIDLAVLQARYHPSANNSFKALSADVEMRYALALEHCKTTHVGSDKETKQALKTCLEQAKKKRASDAQSAHQQAARLASVGTPPKSEAERQRDADLDTSIRKCDSLLGDANLQCVNSLPPAARQRAIERAGSTTPKKQE